MARFNPPFSNEADLRFPTTDEQRQGIPCGPADRELFNGMFHRIEAEIGEVIHHAGLTGTDADLTQLRQAITSLIDAATGGGDPSIYLLMAQARARLPIYPEVMNVDGRIVITAPTTGTIRVPGGVVFQHRGIWPVTTAQQDFTTTASKTYHLRWTQANGFQLRDLTDPIYNPTTAPETDRRFDTGYDDMLVARIITNSSNIATITNLMNKPSILMEIANNGDITSNSGDNLAQRTGQLTWNLSRTPIMSVYPTNIDVSAVGNTTGGFPANAIHDHDFGITRTVFNRYGCTLTLLRDYAVRFNVLATVSA